MQNVEQKLTEDLGRICSEQRDFAELERKLKAFSPFRVLQVERYELRHTTTLAWLLDPRETHGMGDVFLKRFVHQIINQNESWARKALREIEDGNVEILRELKFASHGAIAPTISDNESSLIGDRLDILLEGKDWGIAVEAKIDSKEGENQLQRYDGWLDSMFEEKVLKLYLTVDSIDPVNVNWKNIQWGTHVKNALVEALDELEESSIELRVKEFLEDYCELISGLSDRGNCHDEGLIAQIRAFANRDDVASVLLDLQETIETKKVVRRWDDGGWPYLYWQHKFLLDLCMKHLRSRNASFAWETVRKMIADHGDEWRIITSNHSNALTVEFAPDAWRNLNNVMTKTNDWNICYQAEFRNHANDVEVKLHLRSGGNHDEQVSILREFLVLLPCDDCPPALRQGQQGPNRLAETARRFMAKTLETMKVYSVKAPWTQHEDGTYKFREESAGYQKLRQFKDVVEAHTRFLQGTFKRQSDEFEPVAQAGHTRAPI